MSDIGSNTTSSEHDPDWVDAILDWRWTWPIARLCLTSLFPLAAAIEILDFPAAAAEAANRPLPRRRGNMQ
jgi:hypothetical protein